MADPYGYTLHPIPTEQTGRCGCIGMKNTRWAEPADPVSGFAEIDPYGLFASAEEADALAAELCKRWNLHHELIEALEVIAAGREPMERSERDDRCVHRRSPDEECIYCVRAFAKAALAKARGGDDAEA